METDHLLRSTTGTSGRSSSSTVPGPARQASMPSLILPTRNHRPHQPTSSYRRLPSSETSVSSSLSSSSFPNQGYYSSDNNNSTAVPTTTTKRDADAERIYQASKAAGTPAFGVVMVDVWVLNDSLQQFVHAGPESTWICPAFVIQATPAERVAIARIVDPQHPQYCTPQPQPMGAGLAGWFWSTLAVKINEEEGDVAHHTREGSQSSLPSEAIWLWRDLAALTSDPFQPPYPRMQVLQEAGLGKATGVPFSVNGTRGVVLYLTRPDVNENLLVESSNISFLKAAAQFVGTACALSKPRRSVSRMRQSRLATTWRRLSARIKSSPNLRKLRVRASLREVSISDSFCEHVQRIVRRRLSMLVHKSRGSNSILPPPPAPMRACLWTMAGVATTLWMLQGLSHLSLATSGQPILLAPFGAFLTLQYTQTSAPVSQPRNAVLGQTLCLLVAWLSSICCSSNGQSRSLPLAVQLPVAVATGIALMQKLGLSHPPAAATLIAILVEPEGFSWNAAVWIWIGNVGAIAAAILVNNLSDHRQYPMYWRWGITRALQDILEWVGFCAPPKRGAQFAVEKGARTLVVDSPTLPSMYYSDSDRTFVRNFDDEDPGEDSPLQF